MDKILKKFNVYESHYVRTHFDLSIHLRKNQGDLMSQLEYAQIIGNLMYAMNCTWPDIAYSVSKLSSFTSNLSNDH